MTKKQILEKLISSFGLKPSEVQYYTTSEAGGQYEKGLGWKGSGLNKKGESVIRFYEPDGFDMAVYEILRQAISKKLTPVYHHD